MFTKHNINQLTLATSILSFITAFVIAGQVTSWEVRIVCFALVVISLHYVLNLVHIGTHNLLSKNRRINSILSNVAAFFGGITFAAFRTTHLLHHRFTSEEDKDPDLYITKSGPIWSIPFKILYHDVFFWRQGLWKQNSGWQSYLITRILQITLISTLFFSSYRLIWVYYWLVPMLILGLLNGMFLFYFPHYSTKLERKWRAKPTPYNYIPRTLIDISRIYHERHHDKINNNQNYYPIIASLNHFIINKNFNYSLHLKYTDISKNS